MENKLPIIKIPKRITKEFIRSHSEYIFVYSDMVFGVGQSNFGQCGVCAGEPNCMPLPTRWKLCKSSGFFSDNAWDEIKDIIDEWIKDIIFSRDNIGLEEIIPIPHIGCGASRMKEFAPKLWKYMHTELNKIAYPNIEYV